MSSRTLNPSEPLLDRLRRRGWLLTAQRRVVAEVLEGAHVHLTANEIQERATTRLPEVSRATVYNILRELMALGEILELGAEGRAKRYDPNARDPHQHLRCERCGTIRDVHPEGERRLRLPISERYGFAITGVDIVFRGVCRSCGGGGRVTDRAHWARSKGIQHPAGLAPRAKKPRRSALG